MAQLIFLVLIPVVLLFIFIAFLLTIYFSIPSRRTILFYKKHALVTGGSKGIGKQLAIGLLERGCNVTIVARNKEDLRKIAEELQAMADDLGQNQRVEWLSLDLATSSYEDIERSVRDAEEKLGPVEVLINNAGHSVQADFMSLPITDFEQQMKVNYLSAVYMTRAVIGKMKELKSGHISFVSSAAGQMAIYGYTAYSPTKFALRGFADALHMELLPYKIGISVLYPPNTDTEGFKVELETMPEEVRLISESAGLFTPKFVAEKHLEDIENGNYATTIGRDGWMLGIVTAGGAPEHNLWRAASQVLFSGLFRGVFLVVMGQFHGIVKKQYRRRLLEQDEGDKTKKSAQESKRE